MITPSAQKPSPAEQAKALLADAANKDRFYNNSSCYDDRPRQALREGDDAATALYAAQAATAQALLAVVGELAALRVEVRQAATARLEELPNLASGMRGLAAALKPLQDIAGSVDGLTDQVEAIRDEVEDGLAHVAGSVELLADRRRSGGWSRLLWWRRRPVVQARPSVVDVREALMGTAAAKAIKAHGEEVLGLLAGLDAVGQDTTRPLVLTGGAPAHRAWCAINQIASQGRFLPERLRDHWLVRPAQQLLEETLDRVLTTELSAAAAVADLRQGLTGLMNSVEVAAPAIRDELGLRPALRHSDATRSLPPLDTDTVAPVVPAIPAGQCALERLAHLREVLANWAVTLPDSPNRSGLRQGLAATVYDAWEATRAVIAQVAGKQPISVPGPVQDAVLLLETALHEMGPAGVPSIDSVRAVSDRLTELLKAVAAEAVAARAEVDR
jgi:uncharacterized protein YigA (DUF484 family)